MRGAQLFTICQNQGGAVVVFPFILVSFQSERWIREAPGSMISKGYITNKQKYHWKLVLALG